MPNFLQGYYKPRNPRKYKGNPLNIVYRSSLELKYMCWLDDNPDVLQWSSEELPIRYLDKATGRSRLYYPDFWYRTKAKQYIIEIKPAHQCRPPRKTNKKTYIKEVRTYATNVSKWEAANKFAENKGIQFIVLTEKDLAKL